MINRKAEMIGLFLGVIAGGFALSWWKKSKEVKDSKTVDTGKKTPDGKAILEVTGIGGEDNGKSVKGYLLPDKIDDVKFPLTVIVRPNKDLFLQFKVGDNVIFPRRRGEDMIHVINGQSGEYAEWYSNLKQKVLGAL
jgi:hypothetical protein